MNRRLIFVAAILSATTTLAAATDTAYRLAGIIAPAEGPALALIELPDGEQQLVRAGDFIGETRVTDVTDRLVRLQLPEGEVVLELAESDRERPDAARTASSTGPAMIDAEARTRLEELVAQAEKLEQQKLARRLATELGLGNNQRISAVNQTPVTDPTDTVRAIARELSGQRGDSPLKLVISFAEPGAEEFRVYYVAPPGEAE